MTDRSFVHEAPATRVVFARHALDRVPEEVDRLGRSRVMLVTGSHEVEASERLRRALGDRVVSHFADVVEHVPAEVARAAVSQARDHGADVLVSLGGGSATGTAKAIARETRLPIIAVPTTYAGSEMTPIWGMTEDGRKVTGRDPAVLPVSVVYDPDLTLGLPPGLSAASGMNALAHLVEGRYSAASPVSNLLAEEGIRALASALPRVVTDGSYVSARSDALYGAWLAGWTLGTTGMAIHHKVCHVLGGSFGLPHAATHSAVLPHAMDFNAVATPEAMAAVARALADGGVPCSDAAQGAWDLAVRIDAPTSLRELGLSRDDVARAAEIVMESPPVNPRALDLEGVRGLIAAAYEGARPRARG